MMKDFHLAPIEDKLSVLSQIQDSRFRTLGLRVIAENWPDAMTVQKRNEFSAWARKRMTDNATGNSLTDELHRSKKALFERATDGHSIDRLSNIMNSYQHILNRRS